MDALPPRPSVQVPTANEHMSPEGAVPAVPAPTSAPLPPLQLGLLEEVGLALVSAACSCLGAAPVQRGKLLLQTRPVGGGLLQTLRHVKKREGLRGLWRGYWAGVLHTGVAGGLTSYLQSLGGADLSAPMVAVRGLLAFFVPALLAYPLEFARVQLMLDCVPEEAQSPERENEPEPQAADQAAAFGLASGSTIVEQKPTPQAPLPAWPSDGRQYHGILDVMAKTLDQGGAAGLWRGLGVSIAGTFISRFIYAFLMGLVRPDPQESVGTAMLFYWLVPPMAELAAYPLEVLKARMIHGSLAAGECVAAMRREGYGAFFRGASVDLTKSLVLMPLGTLAMLLGS